MAVLSGTRWPGPVLSGSPEGAPDLREQLKGFYIQAEEVNKEKGIKNIFG